MQDDTGSTGDAAAAADTSEPGGGRYDELVDAVEDGIYQLDPDGRFVAVNDAIVEVTGYDREELIGSHVSTVLDDVDVARVEAAISALLETDADTVTLDLPVRTAEGTVIPCEARTSLLTTDGEFRGTTGVVRDVSDRLDGAHDGEREWERDVDSVAGRYESMVTDVLDGADVGVFVLDEAYDVAWVNEATERYFGLDREAVLGRDKRQLVEEQISDVVGDPDRFAERVLATYEAGAGTERFECRVTPGDGREGRWLEHRSKPIESGQYAGGRVELYYDVTEQQRTARALEESEQRYARLLDNIPGMVYRCRNEAGWPMAFVSEGCADLTGYDPDAVTDGTVEWGPDVVHPEDREHLVDEIEQGLAADGQFTVQYRIRTAEGETRWVWEQGRGVDDGEGEHPVLEGVIMDVTEQKTTEEALRESERRFRSLVEAVEEYAIVMLDPGGRVVTWNEGGERLLGYGREAVVGEHVSTFYTEADVAAGVPGENLATARETGAATDEGWRVREDGSRFWAKVTVTAIHDDDGSLQGFAKVTRDMTDRREYEQRIREERDELATELSAVLDRVDDAFFALDDDWRFTYLNEGGRDAVREAIGREASIEELVGERIWETIPGLEETTFGERYREAMATQEAVAFEEFYEPVDAWFEVRVYPSESGLSIYFSEVSDRKERERELERYETIVETVDDGIYVLDEAFEFVMVNDAYCKLTGYDREELLGAHCSLVVDEDVSAESAELVEEMASGDAASAAIEADVHRADGSTVPAESKFSALPAADDEHPRKVGIVRDLTERRERERELERYETIVESIWDGVYALDDEERFVLVNEAFCEMTGYDREALLGEHASLVHSETINETAAEMAGDTDAASGPAILEFDLRTADGGAVPVEARFGPYEYADGEHGRAGVTRDVTERIEREQELERQRERLVALNNLNEVVLDITDAAIDQSTREEVEQVVCDALASSDSYEFAWVGEVDPATETVQLRAEAGAEGGLDDVTIPVDPDDRRSQGPTGRAVRTTEMQVTQDVLADPDYEPWRDHAREHGYGSAAAIPIVHDETLYGVLTVFAARSEAFHGEERAVVGQLGEIVGHAIAAVERKRALTSDEVLEVDFHVPDAFDQVVVDDWPDEPITLERSLPLGDGEYLVYGATTADGIGVVEAIADAGGLWDAVRVVGDEGDRVRFELHVADPPVISALAAHGGYLATARIEDGDFDLTVQVPPSVEVRQIVEVLQAEYPAATMLARRQVTRPEDGPDRTAAAFESDLTDRQRTVLEAAYYAGYFDWPRKSSGEDLSDALDIAPATFSQHLRQAENRIVGALVDGEPAD